MCTPSGNPDDILALVTGKPRRGKIERHVTSALPFAGFVAIVSGLVLIVRAVVADGSALSLVVAGGLIALGILALHRDARRPPEPGATAASPFAWADEEPGHRSR